jgi:hypothetical protein
LNTDAARASYGLIHDAMLRVIHEGASAPRPRQRGAGDL